MKKIVAVSAVVLAVAGLAAARGAKKQAVAWPAAKLQWTELVPGKGIMAAALWGDMKKGEYGALVKYPAGAVEPLHGHRRDMMAVVVSGSMVYASEGGPETALGPGSYLMVPGELEHSSRIGEDAPCVLLQVQSGKYDSAPAQQKK